jgi:hypothetical protein
MCHSYNIIPEQTTVKNPQAQALVERIPITMGEIFRVTPLSNPDGMEDVDRLIQAAAEAIRGCGPSN